MSGTVVVEALSEMRAAFDRLAAAGFDGLSRADLTAAIDDYEALSCALPSMGHRMLAELQTRTTAVEMGAKNWNQVLATRWRITTAEAGRRLSAAAELAPRQQITGPPLPPLLPAVAAAQAAGLINAEHVTVLRDTMRRPPVVPVGSGRSRTRRHRAAAPPRPHRRETGPRRDEQDQRLADAGDARHLGGDLRQVRRPRHGQPRRC